MAVFFSIYFSEKYRCPLSRSKQLSRHILLRPALSGIPRLLAAGRPAVMLFLQKNRKK
jgi:hypothetical protein